MSDNPADRSRPVNEIQIAAILDLGGSEGGPPNVATMVNPVAIPIVWEWVRGGTPAEPGPAPAEPLPLPANVTGARPEN